MTVAGDCANGAGTPAAADPFTPTGLTGVNANKPAEPAPIAILEF